MVAVRKMESGKEGYFKLQVLSPAWETTTGTSCFNIVRFHYLNAYQRGVSVHYWKYEATADIAV